MLIQCGKDDFRSPIWMALKYLKRFQDRVADPKGVSPVSPKNIVMNVKACGHFGDAQNSG